MDGIKDCGTSANYIRYVPKVTFREPGYVAELFDPYQEIAINVTENYECPFCGQIHCNCNSRCYPYVNAVRKLFKQYGFLPSHCEVARQRKLNVFYRSVGDIETRLLSKSEVKKFGPDFWDFSKLYNVCGKMGFRFANEYYDFDSKEVGFYWKNLETKEVFLCSLSEIEIETDIKIILRSKDDGSSIAEYENYNDFVKELLKFWIKNALCLIERFWVINKKFFLAICPIIII